MERLEGVQGGLLGASDRLALASTRTAVRAIGEHAADDALHLGVGKAANGFLVEAELFEIVLEHSRNSLAAERPLELELAGDKHCRLSTVSGTRRHVLRISGAFRRLRSSPGENEQGRRDRVATALMIAVRLDG
jgi:hypothetical protein